MIRLQWLSPAAQGKKFPSKRKVLSVVVVSMALTVSSLVPASGVTSWTTKASVNSKGASYWTTDSALQTVVEKPYAIRLAFRTTNSRSNKVTYSYYAICDNRSKSASDRTITTPSANSWRYVTLYSGSSSLGRFCDVSVSSSLGTTARLRPLFQAKHP
jgi:hypothetical protein